MRINTALIFLMLLISSYMSAQKRPDISKPVLTAADVENFINNYKAMNDELRTVDAAYDPENDFKTYIDSLKSKQQVNEVIRRYGYPDVNDFSNKVMAISYAFLSIKMETEGSPEYENALRKIEEDESLTPEQKEQSKEQLKKIMGAMGSAFTSMVNKEDIETVRPYTEKLSAVFDYNKVSPTE
jgi:hypothetical protein